MIRPGGIAFAGFNDRPTLQAWATACYFYRGPGDESCNQEN